MVKERSNLIYMVTINIVTSKKREEIDEALVERAVVFKHGLDLSFIRL